MLFVVRKPLERLPSFPSAGRCSSRHYSLTKLRAEDVGIFAVRKRSEVEIDLTQRLPFRNQKPTFATVNRDAISVKFGEIPVNEDFKLDFCILLPPRVQRDLRKELNPS